MRKISKCEIYYDKNKRKLITKLNFLVENKIFNDLKYKNVILE